MYRNRVVATAGAGQPPGRLPGRPARAARALAAVGCAVLLSNASAAHHPFRLSVADVAVAGPALDVRIRFFWDDLQFAVMESLPDMEFRLAETKEADMTVQRYINDMLTIEAAGAVVEGKVVERGIQDARNPDEVMWWYRLEYPLEPSVDRVRIRNRVLFNVFEDQRNLIHLKTRRGRERTYYFSWDEEHVTVRL